LGRRQADETEWITPVYFCIKSTKHKFFQKFCKSLYYYLLQYKFWLQHIAKPNHILRNTNQAAADDNLRKKMEKISLKGRIPKGPSKSFFIKNAEILANPNTNLYVLKAISKQYSGVASYRNSVSKRIYIIGKAELSEKIYLATGNFVPSELSENEIAYVRAFLGKGMMTMNMDSEWKSQRQSMAKNFNPTFVFNHYSKIIEKHLTKIINEISENVHPINISEKICFFSGNVLSSIVFPNHTLTPKDFLEIARIVSNVSLDFRDTGQKDLSMLFLQNKKKLLLKKMENFFDNFIANQTDNCSLFNCNWNYCDRIYIYFDFLSFSKISRNSK
jgi:cytochrome P450